MSILAQCQLRGKHSLKHDTITWLEVGMQHTFIISFCYLQGINHSSTVIAFCTFQERGLYGFPQPYFQKDTQVNLSFLFKFRISISSLFFHIFCVSLVRSRSSLGEVQNVCYFHFCGGAVFPTSSKTVIK